LPNPISSMHTNWASTSRTSNTRSDFISEAWRRWELNSKTHFVIKDEFKHNDDMKWAVREFKRWGLTSLFHLVTDVVYQCLVRLFFQNLTLLSSHHIVVTSLDIAHALGCPLECPPEKVRRDGTPHYGSPSSDLTTLIMVEGMCNGRFINEYYNCTSKSLLPPRLWFVDTVLTKNVCPLGHKM
jgi:hypothetical protein